MATESDDVAAFNGILAFPSTQKVTPNTTAFTVRFDVTNGVAVAKTGEGSSTYIGVGPFDMTISVQ